MASAEESERQFLILNQTNTNIENYDSTKYQIVFGTRAVMSFDDLETARAEYIKMSQFIVCYLQSPALAMQETGDNVDKTSEP